VRDKFEALIASLPAAGITALTGDVTGTGPGSTAATIANDAVTYAKMQNVSAASRLIGRGSSGGSGDAQELTVSTGLQLTGVDLQTTGVASEMITSGSLTENFFDGGGVLQDLAETTVGTAGTVTIYGAWRNRYGFGDTGGRISWSKLDDSYQAYWDETNSIWAVWDAANAENIYESTDDVDYPWEVTTWTEVNSGVAPGPSFTEPLAFAGGGNVSLAGTPDYITISGQTITRGLIDLTTDVTGSLPQDNFNGGGMLGVLVNTTASGAGTAGVNQGWHNEQRVGYGDGVRLTWFSDDGAFVASWIPGDSEWRIFEIGETLDVYVSTDDVDFPWDVTTWTEVNDGVAPGPTFSEPSVYSLGGVGTPGGSDTQVQYNNAGAFAGDAGLTYDAGTDTLTVGLAQLTNDGGGNGSLKLWDGTNSAYLTLSAADDAWDFGVKDISAGIIAGTFVGNGSGLTNLDAGDISAGTLAVANGGTGATTLTANNVILGNGTSPVQFVAPGTSGNVLTSNGTTWASTSGFNGTVGATTPAAGAFTTVGTSGSITVSTGGIFTPQVANTASQSSVAGTILETDGNGPKIRANGTAYSIAHSGGVFLYGSTAALGVNSTKFGLGANPTAPDVIWERDAANEMALRRTTNAQILRVYDTYTSSTDYHRMAMATVRISQTATAGATITLTGLIPDGAVVMGVTSKVTTTLTGGVTGYQVGTGADPDRWGVATSPTVGNAGAETDNADWTSGTIECFTAATDVILTADGANFSGTGVIYVSVQYMKGEVD